MDNENVSLLYVQGDDLASIIPDNLCITHKNKRRKTSDTSVIRKHYIQEPVNPRKSSK